MNILKPLAAIIIGGTLFALLPEAVKLTLIVLAIGGCACAFITAAIHRYADITDVAADEQIDEHIKPLHLTEAAYSPNATLPLGRAA